MCVPIFKFFCGGRNIPIYTYERIREVLYCTDGNHPSIVIQKRREKLSCLVLLNE
jgi:hypothetical protein